jgi:hypothetical protein
MNVNDIKIHCSSIGKLMTDPQSAADKAAGVLSKTAQSHCVEIFAEWYYHRHEDVYSKYFDKGNLVEEDSITLLSVHAKRVFRKNDGTFVNDYLIGTPDILTLVGDAVVIVDDIKSAYDIFTFLDQKFAPLSKDNYWQLMGYMTLTGAKTSNIRRCLVNATPELIDDEKRSLMYKMRASVGDEKYFEKCCQIERNMIYDMGLFRKQHPEYFLQTDLSEWKYDIPASQRIVTIPVERNEDAIQSIYQRVEKARQFIQTLMP